MQNIHALESYYTKMARNNKMNEFESFSALSTDSKLNALYVQTQIMISKIMKLELHLLKCSCMRDVHGTTFRDLSCPQHGEQIILEPIQCPHCDATYFSSEDLLYHLEHMHLDKKIK